MRKSHIQIALSLLSEVKNRSIHHWIKYFITWTNHL